MPARVCPLPSPVAYLMTRFDTQRYRHAEVALPGSRSRSWYWTVMFSCHSVTPERVARGYRLNRHKDMLKNAVFYTIASTVVWLIAEAVGADIMVSMFASILVPPLILAGFLVARYNKWI